MALREFLQSQYGIRTDVIETEVTVGNTPVALVGNNPNRISYTVSNLGAQPVYGSHHPAVTTTTGVYIPSTGAIGFDWRVDADTVGYDFYAVASTGSNICYVREVVIIPDDFAVGK